jgi:solute carrier family 35 protein F5
MPPATSDGPGPRVFGVPRRTLGIILLLVVVVLWTASNFLGSVCAPHPQTNTLRTF